MRNFLFSILITSILFSCTSYKDNFTPEQKIKETFTPSFLIQKNIEQVFKVNIEVYGHQFGGILAIKKIEPEHYRIAMLTEIGAKLLDFELQHGEMKLNYAIEQLNRKIILNILKQDFLILLNEQASVQSQYSYNGDDVYQTLFNGKNLYYFEQSATQKLEKAVWASRKKEKIIFTYNYQNENFPDVEIIHKNIKLQIQLRLLDN